MKTNMKPDTCLECSSHVPARAGRLVRPVGSFQRNGARFGCLCPECDSATNQPKRSRSPRRRNDQPFESVEVVVCGRLVTV